MPIPATAASQSEGQSSCFVRMLRGRDRILARAKTSSKKIRRQSACTPSRHALAKRWRSLGKGERDGTKNRSYEPRAISGPWDSPSVVSRFTLRRQTLRVRRCPFLASHKRNAAVSNASVRDIGSTLGLEEIPAVVAILLLRRRLWRPISFFSFRPIFLRYHLPRQPRPVAHRHPLPKVERRNSPNVA
jgi:hypothetical protein